MLHGSWDMADLKPFVTGISTREAARLLIYQPRYGTETLFSGIHRPTERAKAVFGGALHLRYPEPALHLRPCDLSCDVAVLGGDGPADLVSQSPRVGAPVSLQPVTGWPSSTASTASTSATTSPNSANASLPANVLDNYIPYACAVRAGLTGPA